jgi:hypothetical protein
MHQLTLTTAEMRKTLLQEGFMYNQDSKFLEEKKSQKTLGELATLKKRGWIVQPKRSRAYVKFWVLLEENQRPEIWTYCARLDDVQKVKTFLGHYFTKDKPIAV